MSSAPKVLFGFHAVGVRVKTAPQSVIEIYFDPTRRDARMRQFVDRATEAGIRLIEADGPRLAKLSGGRACERNQDGSLVGRTAGRHRKN
jgi:23S rRNA (guanosine2251-2'-O)-methyltransferase